MGAGGINAKEKLKNLLDNTQERLDDIAEYYKNFGEIKKTDENFPHHSTIILITLREIENIMNKLSPGEDKTIKIPQYNYNLRKIYEMRFRGIDLDNEIITKFREKIGTNKIILANKINLDDLETNIKVSVIENIISTFDEIYLYNIIENSYNSNFHKFFINNYVHDFIKIKMDGKNIYTKEILFKLKMAKYITRILIFTKLYAIYYNKEEKDKLTENELKQSFKIVFNEESVMTNFLFYECKKREKQINPALLNDSKKALDELVHFYQKLLKLIMQIENKMSNNN